MLVVTKIVALAKGSNKNQKARATKRTKPRKTIGQVASPRSPVPRKPIGAGEHRDKRTCRTSHWAALTYQTTCPPNMVLIKSA